MNGTLLITLYDVVSVATCLNKNHGAEGLKVQNIKNLCLIHKILKAQKLS